LPDVQARQELVERAVHGIELLAPHFVPYSLDFGVIAEVAGTEVF
jgi:hypothetical protein